MISKLASVVALLFATVNASANFIGTASGVFTSTNPVCGGATICSGVGTNSITYGTPLQGSFASAETFTGAHINALSQAVSIGDLAFANGATISGTEIQNFSLTINFTADAGSPSVDPLVLGFRVFSTPNVGTPQQNADRITLLTINDLTILQTQQFLQGNGVANNSFNVLEGLSTPVQILAHFSSPTFAGFGVIADPQAGFLSQASVPEPSTPGLIAIGLAGLFLFGSGKVSKRRDASSAQEARINTEWPSSSV
jgi:hypothetical protein